MSLQNLRSTTKTTHYYSLIYIGSVFTWLGNRIANIVAGFSRFYHCVCSMGKYIIHSRKDQISNRGSFLFLHKLFLMFLVLLCAGILIHSIGVLTGAAIFETQPELFTYSENIDQSFDSTSREYAFTIDNHPDSFVLESVTIDGSIQGEGIVTIYLETDDGNQLLLFSDSLVRRHGAPVLVTGLVTGDSDGGSDSGSGGDSGGSAGSVSGGSTSGSEGGKSGDAPGNSAESGNAATGQEQGETQSESGNTPSDPGSSNENDANQQPTSESDTIDEPSEEPSEEVPIEEPPTEESTDEKPLVEEPATENQPEEKPEAEESSLLLSTISRLIVTISIGSTIS